MSAVRNSQEKLLLTFTACYGETARTYIGPYGDRTKDVRRGWDYEVCAAERHGYSQ